jgi:hypothetical protein
MHIQCYIWSFSTDRQYDVGKEGRSEKWVVEAEDWKEFQGIRIPYKTKLTWKLKSGDFNCARITLRMQPTRIILI